MSEPIKLPEALRLADVPICQRSLEWQSNATAELRRLYAEVERLRADAERWKCLTAHASLGFDVPSWNAVIRLPVFDAADQTIGALVDSIRAVLKGPK